MEESNIFDRARQALPRIIQGGMGVSVSNWKLAGAVARKGEMGVVSGTAIDSVLVRELQQGDPHGRLKMLESYPDPGIVAYLRDKFFVKGGIPDGSPYKLLPIHKFNPTVLSQQIMAAAAYSEVMLAKLGHDGLIGINLLAKIKRQTLSCMYGAMIAGVSAILMGAGIPVEEAEQVQNLADGQMATLRIDVDNTLRPDMPNVVLYQMDPSKILPEVRQLSKPMFFPIISSDLLAGILAKKLPAGTITGFIVEGFTAGGHNAPPRNKAIDEEKNPVYDRRDIPDLTRIASLGYPFYLAGGYGTPEGVKQAVEAGATGVQIGSLFSLTNESGYTAETKRRLILAIHEKKAQVRTDGRLSSTGFPFKVLEVEGTLGIPENLTKRTRICDLGYLQSAYTDEKGRVQGRCSAEPVDTYLAKGGKLEDTERRGCLCNGLMANIGLGQMQKWGAEQQLFTAGDDIVNLPLGSIDEPHYSAADVIDYLHGRVS